MWWASVLSSKKTQGRYLLTSSCRQSRKLRCVTFGLIVNQKILSSIFNIQKGMELFSQFCLDPTIFDFLARKWPLTIFDRTTNGNKVGNKTWSADLAKPFFYRSSRFAMRIS